MAGGNIREIKRRIKSVNSTKQITKAMELVSTSKLRKAREKLDQTRPFFNIVKETINEIINDADEIKSQYFVGHREIKKTCYIVITADRGLCGSFNSGVMKEAVLNMKGKEAVSIIAIGQKGRDFFKQRGYDMDGEYLKVLENVNFGQAKKISDLALQLYKEEMVDELYLVYTNFVSTLSQKAEAIRLLPLDQTLINTEETDETDDAEKNKGKDFEFISYEPSPEGLFEYLVPKYIESLIFGSLVESATSEQGARRVAMESATDNAEEMIDALTLHYNRARQAAITQEISEIVAGAEAIK